MFSLIIPNTRAKTRFYIIIAPYYFNYPKIRLTVGGTPIGVESTLKGMLDQIEAVCSAENKN